ncbi:hypothetical protein BH23BAC1_BH23BAC1_34990 [soil metagenome]
MTVFILRLLLFSLFFSNVVFGQGKENINILIITGGHDFDRESFFGMFDKFENLNYQEVEHPEALNYLNLEKSSTYDVLVFYDMPSEISDKHKTDFLELARNGKNMLFLHHSIVSYDGWEEYENLVGGHYYNRPYQKGNTELPSSEYSHDENIKVYIENKEHPITKGISDFDIFDETYNNVYINKNIEPLIATDHPQSNKIIGWINRYKNSKIVYLQPGHGPQIFENKNYQTLVEQSIRWLTE